MNLITQPTMPQLRVRVFVDFWNFTLSLKNIDEQFKVDWQIVGQVLAKEAAKIVDPNLPLIYEGMNVYGSYDPNKSRDVKLKNWFTNTLDKMAGVNVIIQPRQRKKGFPRCPQCQSEVTNCSVCESDMRGTEEKGVDTRLATDVVSLAWANSYNCAVLVSSDRDFVPVAEFLQTRGIKIVHGAFPPSGNALSQKCWGHVNIPKMLNLFQRT